MDFYPEAKTKINVLILIGGVQKTALTGTEVGQDLSGSEKVWRTFQAIGDIAFAYAYSTVLIEIQVLKYYRIIVTYILCYFCCLVTIVVQMES